MSTFRPNRHEEETVLSALMNNFAEESRDDFSELLEAQGEVIEARLTPQSFQVDVDSLSNVIRQTHMPCIDLLKVDVQKAEHDVLLGLEDEHWPLIRQIVVEVHDFDGRLASICHLLKRKGFVPHAEQSKLYIGTNLHCVYARRV